MKTRKKTPFQIYLEPEQEKMIELLALQTKKSKAAIIRLCISRYMETLPLEEDPALNIINLGSSGIKDISEKHDQYLMRIEMGKPE
jgi:predicted DNA-binding protein